MGQLLQLACLSAPCAVLLASCAVISTPASTASGWGIRNNASIAIVVRDDQPSALIARTENALARALTQSGYRVEQSSDLVLEFGLAKRPLEVGILLLDTQADRAEAGTWRARPMERDQVRLCTASVYRLMVTVAARRTGEILVRSQSDDDMCGDIGDARLQNLVSSTVAQIRSGSRP